jgi:hypothetical protein
MVLVDMVLADMVLVEALVEAVVDNHEVHKYMDYLVNHLTYLIL